MKKSKTKRSRGIWIRGFAPLIILILALCFIIYIYIGHSGMPQQLRAHSNNTMEDIVQARNKYLSDSMVKRWGELTTGVEILNTLYDELISSKGNTIEQVVSQETLYTEFLNAALKPTIDILRRNVVSGVFIVLADSNSVSTNTTKNLPGIFLRDRDPTSAYNNTNKDLLFQRGPLSVVQTSGISTDSHWIPNFSIQEDGDLNDVFFHLYSTALSNTDKEPSALSYWSSNSALYNDNVESFYYALPLISNTGEVYGILGIDILKSYLREFIPHQELSNGEGAYGLYKTQEDGSLIFLESFSKIGKYMDDFWLNLSFTPTSNFQTLAYEFDTMYNVQISKIKLYDSTSPFNTENWYLCAIAPYDILYRTTNDTMNSITLIVVWLALITIIGVGTILYQIASPIKRLERQLKACHLDSDELNLDPTGISELDLLANAIENLNIDIRTSARKFSQLLEMSSINLGTFEFNRLNNLGFISHNFFRVFNDETIPNRLDLNTSLEKLKTYQKNVLPETLIQTNDNFEGVCEITNTNGISNFVRIKIETTEEFIRAFVEDVSIEWREIRKLAYERNHDNLTDIYNRRGFYEQYYELMKLKQDELKISAVIMLDLDNLKSVNDNYGHDAGDRYIKGAANVLKRHASKQVIVSRISGDEFLVFIYGFHCQSDCNNFLSELEKSFTKETIILPNNNLYPLQISAGVAFYPTDSLESNELIRFADFAMYQGKRSIKGHFTRFDKNTFAKEELRLRSKEALNQFIFNNEVKFFFQPIVSIKTMEIFAYEALMRPQNDLLKSPLDVLSVAKAENRLQEIESMTILGATESFVNWCEKGIISNSKCKLFLNTITTETMTEEQISYFENKYSKYISRIVIEYTEEEKAREEVLAYKQEFVKKWSGEIALDDYGSGYNGESMLLETDVQYIKLDINMIKNIHKDSNRKQRVSDLLNYAHPRGIFVIGEGVESKEECLALQELGVDFLQGYYLARPDFIPPTPDIKSLLS